MQRKIKRLQWYFNLTTEAMNEELAETKMALNYMRGERQETVQSIIKSFFFQILT